MVKGYYGYYLLSDENIIYGVIMVILVIDCYLAIKTMSWLSWLLNYPTETSMLCRGNVMMLYLVFGSTGLRPFL